MQTEPIATPILLPTAPCTSLHSKAAHVMESELLRELCGAG